MDQTPFKKKPRIGESSSGDPNLPCLGHLKKYLHCKTLRVISPQQKLFSQGEFHHSIYFICGGLVKLTRTESDGKQVIVGLRGTGTIMGTSAFLLEMPYAATAEVVVRSKLCFVPIEQFKKAMDTDTLFSQWISMNLSRKVYHSLLKISEKCCLSGKQRLKKLLLELIQAQVGVEPKGPTKIQLMMKNWEVAQLLSVTPQYLCRLLDKLEREGIIRREDEWLIIPHPKKFLSHS